ncbi:hypothetical protein DQ04_27441000, partial [Trypanosoma grayi]|uniref:hypothetical protein n=1 Tax=Trypanosoma grayi TaxID=71804 RepID=UPI0004F4699E
RGAASPAARKGRPLRSLAVFLVCLFGFLHVLPPMPQRVPTIANITAGGKKDAITIVITDTQTPLASARAAVAGSAGSRLAAALRQRAWCSPSPVAPSVSLVLVFGAPPSAVR